MMRWFIVLFSTIAMGQEPMVDLFLERDIALPSPAIVPPIWMVLLPSEASRADKFGLTREYLAALVTLPLRRNGVPHKMASPDFSRRFMEGRLSQAELLASKVIIDLDFTTAPDSGALSAVCLLSFVEWMPDVGGTSFRPKLIRQRRQAISATSSGEIEEATTRFLQAELKGFYPKKREASKRSSLQPGETQMGYSLSWRDRENKRNKWFLGATVGTPAIGNIQFGFWGSRSVPVVVALSGMYYSSLVRGAALDAGWAFDNEGSVKQVLGIAFLLLNRHTESTITTTVSGVPVSRTLRAVDTIFRYLGPSYMVDWNNWRGQLGVAFPIGNDGPAPAQLVGSVGYSFPLDF